MIKGTCSDIEDLSKFVSKTDNNVVIKFKSKSVKRIHDLPLEKADKIYATLIQNLHTQKSYGDKE